MATTCITVSYSGVEKRVPLAIQPSIELSDAEVNTAESDLHSKLRQLFQVPNGVQFYLHEAETQRVMSKESFREYTVAFPSHWYLVNPRDSNKIEGSKENGIMAEGSTDDLMATLGLATPPEMTTPPSDDMSSEGQLFDEEDEVIPQLADLTALEESYSTVSLTCARDGSFGMTLRHFTIQSDSSQRPDTPLDDYERPTSRLSSESIELKLSTTFIHRLTKGSVALGAGLEEGQMVHMLNGTSILRSSADEIRRIVEECGDVLTLLTLPKEHDDLQFLYPRYTYGPSGDYSTKDGQVTATDIKVDRGSKVKPTPEHTTNHVAPSNHVTSGGVAPPSGMMVFNDMDYTSQENSQPSDPRLPRQPVHDDVLVEGSLLDIESHIPSRTGAGKGHSTSRPSEWYDDPDDFPLGQDVSVSDKIIVEATTSETNLLGRPRPLPVRIRTRSNSSLEGRHQVFVPSSQGTSSPSDSMSSRTALTSSMSALDHLGRYHGNYTDRARSTDLGRFKIKKKGNKSLEGLTRIASDGLQQRLSIQPLSEGNKSKAISSPEEVIKPKQPTWNQGVNREISQSSRVSNESSSSLVNEAPSRQKKRGYQNIRRELHSRSRSSRVSVERVIVGGGSVESDLSAVGRGTVQGQRSPAVSQDNETSPPTHVSRPEQLTPEHRTLPKLDEPLHQIPTDSKVALLRNASFSSQSSTNRPQRYGRPMSAIEPTLTPTNTAHNLQVPFSSGPSKKIPLFKTRSIGDQVVREVNIEEAIQASQASQGDRGRVQWPAVPSGRSLSMDVGSILDSKKKTKKLYQRKKQASIDLADGSPAIGKGLGSAIMRLSSEVLNTLGLSTSPSHQQDIQTNIQCHGVLSKKQDLLDSGRRAGDRSWRSFYAVLASNRISFYKDRKEARLRSNCEEPSIDIIPSKADYARDYKNKKFVFRLVTGQGASYLLQASDAPSLKNWVTTIQDLNGGPPTPETTLQRSKDSDSKLAPPSPLASRRASSPQSGRGGRKLLNRLKKKMTRNKDEPDMSSYVTFGQPLEECPVPVENKRVPLVVEYCVNTVESLGLDVEGIYRKPGHAALIKHMSNEMDKGVYEFTQDDIGDVHTVASLCKKFFKELPDPMIPEAVHEDFLTCARTVDEGDRFTMLKDLVHELPTAHYHTLKYLMRHLRKVAAHSEENKMTYRNVALVFGPTLMRGAEQDMLASMNESYTIVETLCKHVEHLFDELCAEELRQTEGSEVIDEVATRGTPTLGHRELDHRQQKDAALATASPQAIRRIRNNLGDHPTDSGGLQPKQTNWDPHIRGANRSVDSGVSSPGDQRSPDNIKQGHKPRRSRHVYEDVERTRPVRQHAYEDVDGLLQQRSGSESRTSTWVNTHSEMGWGKRETTGSMWAPQNRTRRPPRRQESFERDRDLTATYHAPPRAYSGRPRNASTLPTGTSLTSPVKRRVSYISAMGGDTERLTTSYADTRSSTRTYADTQSPARYSQQAPPHRSMYSSGRGYDSLQRGTSSSQSRPHIGSQSSEYDRMQEAKAMLLQAAPTKVSPVHRTRSHGMTRSTGQGINRTPSGRQKQSLL